MVKKLKIKKLMKASGGKPIIVAGGRDFSPTPEQKKLMENATAGDWKEWGKNIIFAQKKYEKKEGK